MGRLQTILLSLLFLLLLSVGGFAAESGALSTAMSEAQYNSYLGQAQMWRARLAVDEKKFVPSFYATGVMNRTFLILFRFQPENADTLNLYERHLSILFDSRSNLVGMVRTKPEWAGMPRIDDKTAVARGTAFIWNHAPELFRFVDSPDIQEHQITTRKSSGEQASINGALVRYTDTRSKTSFFVIVAPDKSVMAFERNVLWDEKSGRRQNESFLYDAWLEQNGYRGPN